MDYETLVNEIIEKRDEVYQLIEDNLTFKITPVLNEIAQKAEEIQADDPTHIIDKISVYEFLGDGYYSGGRMQLALDYYREAIELGKSLADENRQYFEPLRSLYTKLVMVRYLFEGNDSENLKEEISDYVKKSKSLREDILEECQYATKHDPVEDSEEYLAVIDEIEERIYEETKDSDDADSSEVYNQLKKQYLAERGIEWSDPLTYSGNN